MDLPYSVGSPGGTMTGRSRPVAVFIAVVVMVSAVAGVSAVGAQGNNPSGTNGTAATNATGTELPPASDIYVEEDGDAVLAYEGDMTSQSTNAGRANMGLNVSTGLVHALVATDLDGMNDTAANMTAVLTGNEFIGNGTLETPRPDALSDLSVNVTGKQTDKTARSDATVSATLTDMDAIKSVPVENARIAGNMTTTAATFSAAAEAHAKLVRPLGRPQHQAFQITEDNGTYTLNASQKYTVSSYAAQQWSSRQRAKRTLRQQYVSIAKQLGGRADLTLDSYSFTKGADGSTLDIDYTVTYHGIERVLANQLTTRLRSSQNVDLNQSETDTLSKQLRNLTIEQASVSYDQRGRSLDAAMSVELEDYDGVVLGALTVAESTNMTALSQRTRPGMAGSATTAPAAAGNAMGSSAANFNASLEQARKRFEAQQAANLTRRYTFAANVSKRSDRTIAFGGEFHSRSENWGKYVNELEDRGIKTSDVTYDLHAVTENGSVNVTAAVDVSGENLLRGISNQLLNSTESSGAGQAHQYVQAFRQAGFKKARTDLTLHDGRVRVEAGGAFENMTALRDAFVSTTGDQKLQDAVVRTENGTSKGYISMSSAVPANATKQDVRKLSYVDSDTAVHMPDSWNKTFPTTNTTRAKGYLGIAGSGTGLTGPGFGIAVAVLALLAAAFVAVRRRQ